MSNENSDFQTQLKIIRAHENCWKFYDKYEAVVKVISSAGTIEHVAKANSIEVSLLTAWVKQFELGALNNLKRWTKDKTPAFGKVYKTILDLEAMVGRLTREVSKHE